jgi:putative flavoprotein involved in K+ transport
MDRLGGPESFETIVIGGGQAGLATGYHLARAGVKFVILDASERTGDAWRGRWDSLRLFSEAHHNSLPGMRFPSPAHYFPTKDEMAAYLEAYATRFDLPVHHGTRVDRLWREDGRFLVSAGGTRFEADNVVVAMGKYQEQKIPTFAKELDGRIRQFHSSEYRNPGQFQAGTVLIVGAGNSGAEIALEAARDHKTYVAGPDTGHVPFRIDTLASKYIFAPIVVGLVFHHLLTVNTPFGRRMRPKALAQGGPLVRTKPSDLVSAGVERVGHVARIQNGLPLLDDGRVLDVENVVWCTGFHPGFAWIELPVFDEHEMPRHERGVVAEEPGLFFVGLPFLYAFSSVMIRGIGRDAARIAKAIAARIAEGESKEQVRRVKVEDTAAARPIPAGKL